MNEDDKVEIEYCYGGFMGFPLTIFIWSKDKTLLTFINKDEKGNFISRPGAKIINKGKWSRGERFWNWLQKVIIIFINEL
jgi:hypothetical protein